MSVRELTRTSSWHSPFSPTITQVSFPSVHYQIHPGCLSRGQVLLLPVRTCYRPGARTLPGWKDDTCGASLPVSAGLPAYKYHSKKKKSSFLATFFCLPITPYLRFPAGKRQKHALLGADPPLRCPPREALPGPAAAAEVGPAPEPTPPGPAAGRRGTAPAAPL